MGLYTQIMNRGCSLCTKLQNQSLFEQSIVAHIYLHLIILVIVEIIEDQWVRRHIVNAVGRSGYMAFVNQDSTTYMPTTRPDADE